MVVRPAYLLKVGSQSCPSGNKAAGKDVLHNARTEILVIIRAAHVVTTLLAEEFALARGQASRTDRAVEHGLLRTSFRRLLAGHPSVRRVIHGTII